VRFHKRGSLLIPLTLLHRPLHRLVVMQNHRICRRISLLTIARVRLTIVRKLLVMIQQPILLIVSKHLCLLAVRRKVGLLLQIRLLMLCTMKQMQLIRRAITTS
jgi:hypothetical protein